NYNFTNSSQSTLPSTAKEPKEYRFTIDDMVDAAYVSTINGSQYDNGQQISERGMIIKGAIDGAYKCKMHMAVSRKPVYAVYQNSGTELVESAAFDPPGGLGVIARETWRVHSGRMKGNWTEDVTIDYIIDEYSDLGIIRDNVASPYAPISFNGLADPNLANAVSTYKSSTDIDTVLFSRGNDNWTSNNKEITSKYNHWVENYTVYTLGRTSALIKGDIGVSLDIDDYGSYQEMMDSAYGEMERQFDRNMSKYRNDPEYKALDANGNLLQYGYRSCGAKAIDFVLDMYLDDIKCQLNYTALQGSKNVDEAVDDRLENFSDMNSSDLNDNARSSKNFLENTKLYIPFGMAMNLSSQPATSGNYTWKEDVKLAVDQQPDYLSAEEYTDPETGYRTIPLKVRNVCLFTLPTDFLDTKQATGAVLDGIDAIAGTATEMANATITEETTKVVHGIAEGSRERIKTEIREVLLTDVTMEGDVNEGDIDDAVDSAFDKRSPGQIVGDLRNGTLQREIAKDLGDRAKIEAAKKLDDYADQYSDYIETRTEAVVEEAEQKAISSAIDACREEVKGAFKDYMAEAADHLESEAIRDALKRIPSGLPLLPPWGWWATMNVWYIDVQGEIPELTVYDVDNVPVPDPILGHNATAYVRRWQRITGMDGDMLGYYEPIKFRQRTCTFIIVPPGEQGIGDKIGGWEEKSEGFGD
ncbi:MAG TPA: hypothetical protein VGK13_01280, partial [Methanocellaceae archaeon]